MLDVVSVTGNAATMNRKQRVVLRVAATYTYGVSGGPKKTAASSEKMTRRMSVGSVEKIILFGGRLHHQGKVRRDSQKVPYDASTNVFAGFPNRFLS